MVSVASLLNPVDDERSQMPSSCSTRRTYPSAPIFSGQMSTLAPPPPPPSKKQKISKDAPVFTRGKIQGDMRYPPWEDYDIAFKMELRRFSVYPLGQIAEFRRHIPYNSDKKDFLSKTGRGAFEVFQYTFKIPGEDKAYTVMWDYNIGLVRLTPFFKSCGYAKTVPAKMLGSNPGLREICHSITGGALAAQGYWMPFEAAKALAATFCYEIRYALAPLFGPSFTSICVKPGEEGYGHMIIDQSIVCQCAAQCQEYRNLASRENSFTPSAAPRSDFSSSPGIASNWSSKSSLQYSGAQNFRSINHTSSGYCTDLDSNEGYLPSPQSTLTRNASRQTHSNMPGRKQKLFMPSTMLSPPTLGIASGHKTYHNSPGSVACRGEGCPGAGWRKPVTDSRKVEPGGCENKLTKLAESACITGENATLDAKEGRMFMTDNVEMKAAYVLMQLYFADTSLRQTCTGGPRKRRASN